MPNLARTGPKGKGPLTGRGEGKCSKQEKNTNFSRPMRRNRRKQ